MDKTHLALLSAKKLLEQKKTPTPPNPATALALQPLKLPSHLTLEPSIPPPTPLSPNPAPPPPLPPLTPPNPATLPTSQLACSAQGYVDVDDTAVRVLAAYSLATFTPLALATTSQLLGFLAVAVLYLELTFLLQPFLAAANWTRDSGLLNITVMSAAFTALMLASRLPPVRRCGWWCGRLAVFTPGLTTFGAVLLGLAGLLYSSTFFAGAGYKALQLVLLNLAFLAGSLALLLGGALLSIPAYFNTGSTYLFLWLVLKLGEAVQPAGEWPVILVVSAAMCGAAAFLHSRPQWIVTLLSW